MPKITFINEINDVFIYIYPCKAHASFIMYSIKLRKYVTFFEYLKIKTSFYSSTSYVTSLKFHP